MVEFQSDYFPYVKKLDGFELPGRVFPSPFFLTHKQIENLKPIHQKAINWLWRSIFDRLESGIICGNDNDNFIQLCTFLSGICVAKLVFKILIITESSKTTDWYNACLRFAPRIRVQELINERYIDCLIKNGGIVISSSSMADKYWKDIAPERTPKGADCSIDHNLWDVVIIDSILEIFDPDSALTRLYPLIKANTKLFLLSSNYSTNKGVQLELLKILRNDFENTNNSHLKTYCLIQHDEEALLSIPPTPSKLLRTPNSLKTPSKTRSQAILKKFMDIVENMDTQDTRQGVAPAIYIYINATFFNNQLPTDMPIKWRKMSSSAGMFKFSSTGDYSLLLSKSLLDTMQKLILTLAHEMCHAATTLIDNSREDVHGPVWEKWVRILKSRSNGELLITIYHTYNNQDAEKDKEVRKKYSEIINLDQYESD